MSDVLYLKIWRPRKKAKADRLASYGEPNISNSTRKENEKKREAFDKSHVRRFPCSIVRFISDTNALSC